MTYHTLDPKLLTAATIQPQTLGTKKEALPSERKRYKHLYEFWVD